MSEKSRLHYEHFFKSIIVGAGKVGKTSLTIRFAEDRFRESYLPTLGVDFLTKIACVPDTISIELTESVNWLRVKLLLCDIGGQEFVMSLLPVYFAGAAGGVLVYDITNRNSFNSLDHWLKQIQEYTEEIPIILVGNKYDLIEKRQVSSEEAQLFAMKNNLIYLEASAKTGFNAHTIFKKLVKLMIERDYRRNKRTPSEEEELWKMLFQSNIIKLTPKRSIEIEDILQKYHQLNNKQFEKENEFDYESLSSFLITIKSLTRTQQNKTIIGMLYALQGKGMKIFLEEKIKECNLNLFIETYIEMVITYIKAIEFLGEEKAKEFLILDDTLTLLFELYYEMILNPINLDHLFQLFEENDQIILFSRQYGDHFNSFFWSCLHFRYSLLFGKGKWNSPYNEFSFLIKQLKKIKQLFTENHLHRRLAVKTYSELVKQSDPILIDLKTDPNPPNLGEPAFLNLTLRNIHPEPLNLIVNIKKELSQIYRKEYSINAIGENGDIISESLPFGKIETNALGVYIEVEFKDGKHRSISNYLLRGVLTAQPKPIIHLIASEKSTIWKKTLNIKLLTVVFNPASEPTIYQIYAKASWMEGEQNYPNLRINANDSDGIIFHFPVPSVIGEHIIEFNLLDENGLLISSTKKIVKIRISRTVKRLVLDIMDGINTFAKPIANVKSIFFT